ncbi:hypothetical protein [Nocardia sp. NPDC004604]|uniref:hypothetical protein n=1 Tax=Nocardia sp. NPDC004604 TaxID=3157013 RepID=UPI0033B9DD03
MFEPVEQLGDGGGVAGRVDAGGREVGRVAALAGQVSAVLVVAVKVCVSPNK